MKTKNIPKCIREGLFCFMTGAMVFAGSAITAQAEEGDALPQDNDISSDINNSHDDEVENTAASITDEAGDATDGDYGDPVGEPSVETESGDYYETVTTTTEYEESGTDYESTTTVTTETTTYDVENPEYFNKEVDNTDITDVEKGTPKEAVLVDETGTPVLDSEGNEQTDIVSTYTETTTTGHYESKDAPGEWAPYEESVTTSTTTVTTDSKELADQIVANITAEQTRGPQTSIVTDAKGNVIESKTVSVSKITETVNAFGQDVTGMGVSDGDVFVVKSDGTITQNGKVLDSNDKLYEIVKVASEGEGVEKETTYSINVGDKTYKDVKQGDAEFYDGLNVTYDGNGYTFTKDGESVTVDQTNDYVKTLMENAKKDAKTTQSYSITVDGNTYTEGVTDKDVELYDGLRAVYDGDSVTFYKGDTNVTPQVANTDYANALKAEAVKNAVITYTVKIGGQEYSVEDINIADMLDGLTVTSTDGKTVTYSKDGVNPENEYVKKLAELAKTNATASAEAGTTYTITIGSKTYSVDQPVAELFNGLVATSTNGKDVTFSKEGVDDSTGYGKELADLAKQSVKYKVTIDGTEYDVDGATAELLEGLIVTSTDGETVTYNKEDVNTENEFVMKLVELAKADATASAEATYTVIIDGKSYIIDSERASEASLYDGLTAVYDGTNVRFMKGNEDVTIDTTTAYAQALAAKAMENAETTYSVKINGTDYKNVVVAKKDDGTTTVTYTDEDGDVQTASDDLAAKLKAALENGNASTYVQSGDEELYEYFDMEAGSYVNKITDEKGTGEQTIIVTKDGDNVFVSSKIHYYSESAVYYGDDSDLSAIKVLMADYGITAGSISTDESETNFQTGLIIHTNTQIGQTDNKIYKAGSGATNDSIIIEDITETMTLHTKGVIKSIVVNNENAVISERYDNNKYDIRFTHEDGTVVTLTIVDDPCNGDAFSVTKEADAQSVQSILDNASSLSESLAETARTADTSELATVTVSGDEQNRVITVDTSSTQKSSESGYDVVYVNCSVEAVSSYD